MMMKATVFVFLATLVIVDADDDFNCLPGYGVYGEAEEPNNILTSGNCKVPVETDEECKLLASKYNENGIDPNKGFITNGGWSSSDAYGCVHNPYRDKYQVNRDQSNVLYGECQEDTKCICKPRKCNKCPVNTYSSGGKNAKCVKCPKDKPVTNGKIGMDVCSPLVCPPGEGIERESSRTSGVCVSAARNADDCMQMALYNWKNGIEPDEYAYASNDTTAPYGCQTNKGGFGSTKKMQFNGLRTGIQCDADYQFLGPPIKHAFVCFCRINTCGKCPDGFTSPGGPNAECTSKTPPSKGGPSKAGKINDQTDGGDDYTWPIVLGALAVGIISVAGVWYTFYRKGRANMELVGTQSFENGGDEYIQMDD